jgi:hypothetical protein
VLVLEQNEKTREKIALLMRLFWLETLFKIGQQLRIHYFDQFSYYWNINHYQAAVEIAKSIDDEQLSRLARENPSKYELSLGGFQGNYYTATEKGLVTLESSWPKVRENAKRALQRWQVSAYGALQGISNFGGETTYWKLLEEAERLGARISPYLLRRLEALKLLFRTGSNRYPTWTIPPEIVLPVKVELEAFTESGEEVQTRGLPPRNRKTILVQAAQPYTALREVENILDQARNYVKVLDPWLGEEALDFFWKIPQSVRVRILTRTIVDRQRFIVAYQRLVQEKRGSIEIRESDSVELHDRFIIIEDQAWSLGPSLKDLGKKFATITNVADAKSRNGMERFFDRIWDAARQIGKNRIAT